MKVPPYVIPGRRVSAGPGIQRRIRSMCLDSGLPRFVPRNNLSDCGKEPGARYSVLASFSTMSISQAADCNTASRRPSFSLR